jgi:hypothetical protein
MDGVTDNFYDPRTHRQLTIDVVEEAKRAGIDTPDPAKQAAATQKLRELEQKRAAATAEARERVVQAPADAGMGVDGGPKETEKANPLSAQKKRTSRAKEE